MNKLQKAMAMLAAVMAFGGCASPGKGAGPEGKRADGPGAEARAAGANNPSRILRQARDLQARSGCAKSAPAYRIVSAYGEDYDVAQYELGACLLEMTGEGDVETNLFREEALFWLNRSAWAGSPRAQGKLAEILSGAPHVKISGVSPAPQQALAWAIVYDANGARDVFGLHRTPDYVVQHLRAVLSPEEETAAANEASAFRKIIMAAFVPGAESAEDRSDARQQGRHKDGRRPRRQ